MARIQSKMTKLRAKKGPNSKVKDNQQMTNWMAQRPELLDEVGKQLLYFVK